MGGSSVERLKAPLDSLFRAVEGAVEALQRCACRARAHLLASIAKRVTIRIPGRSASHRLCSAHVCIGGGTCSAFYILPASLHNEGYRSTSSSISLISPLSLTAVGPSLLNVLLRVSPAASISPVLVSTVHGRLLQPMCNTNIR